MTTKKFGVTLQVDIHGMTSAEAKKSLERLLSSIKDPTIKEVLVIHGYHNGNVLKNMVRKLKHPCIKQRVLSLNNWETTLVLK